MTRLIPTLLFFLLPAAPVTGLQPLPPLRKNNVLRSSAVPTQPDIISRTALAVSGGAVTEIISTCVRAGPWGVPAMAGVAAVVLAPLTIYRQAYSFSVGYGLSVAAMGGVLLASFRGTSGAALWLGASLVFYGARLGIFLLLREMTVPSKAKSLKSMDKTPVLKRMPLVLGVSLFYALLSSPALYALRHPSSSPLAKVGAAIAWIGATAEAIADLQKFLVKRGKDGDESYAGPTGGLYAVSRHPNYLGEVVYWVGLFLGGAASFGWNPTAWICSSLGLYGIVSIMGNATKRLEKIQSEKYSGQKKYDDYTKQVPYALIPLVKG